MLYLWNEVLISCSTHQSYLLLVSKEVWEWWECAVIILVCFKIFLFLFIFFVILSRSFFTMLHCFFINSFWSREAHCLICSNSLRNLWLDDEICKDGVNSWVLFIRKGKTWHLVSFNLEFEVLFWRLCLFGNFLERFRRFPNGGLNEFNFFVNLVSEYFLFDSFMVKFSAENANFLDCLDH